MNFSFLEVCLWGLHVFHRYIRSIGRREVQKILRVITIEKVIVVSRFRMKLRTREVKEFTHDRKKSLILIQQVQCFLEQFTLFFLFDRIKPYCACRHLQEPHNESSYACGMQILYKRKSLEAASKSLTPQFPFVCIE